MVKNARKFQAKGRYFTHNSCHGAYFMLSHACKERRKQQKTLGCVYFGFCFVLYFGLVSACHNLGITPFFNLIRI